MKLKKLNIYIVILGILIIIIVFNHQRSVYKNIVEQKTQQIILLQEEVDENKKGNTQSSEIQRLNAINSELSKDNETYKVNIAQYKKEKEKLINEKIYLLDESDTFITRSKRAESINEYLAENLYSNTDYNNLDVKINAISTSQTYEQLLIQLKNNKGITISEFEDTYKMGHYFVIKGKIVLTVKEQDFIVNEHTLDENLEYSYKHLVPNYDKNTFIFGEFLVSDNLIVKFLQKDQISDEVFYLMVRKKTNTAD